MALSARKVAPAVSMFASMAAMIAPSASGEGLTQHADSRLTLAGPPIVFALADKISRDEAENYSGAVLAYVSEAMLAQRDKYTARNNQGEKYSFSYYVPATKDLSTNAVYLCYGDKSGKPLVQAEITPEEKVVFLPPTAAFTPVSTTTAPAAAGPATCLEAMKAYYNAHKPPVQVASAAADTRTSANVQVRTAPVMAAQ